jgi:hypothetical protein
VNVSTTRRRRVRIMEHQKPAVRKMDDTHRAIVAPKVGRKKVPSIFREEVAAAIETGEAYQIEIPEGFKPATILSELDKAAKELGVKLKKWKREETALTDADKEAGVKPFVGFQVIAQLAEAPPVTTIPTLRQLVS